MHQRSGSIVRCQVSDWWRIHYFGVDEENKWVATFFNKMDEGDMVLFGPDWHFSTRWRKVIWFCLDQIGNPTHELSCNFIGDYMNHVLWADRLHMDRVRTYLGT